MNRTNELQAGIFIILATILIVLTLFTLGKERQYFVKLVTLHSKFQDVQGLAEEAPVRLGGITIGRVDKIAFSDNLQDTNVHISLLINEKYLERIKMDSKVTIDTQGLLGDRFISVSSGKDGAPVTQDAELKSYKTGDISKVLEKAGIVAEEAATIAQNVSELIAKVKEDTIDNVSDSFENISNITKEIEKGQGFIGRLVYSKKEGKRLMASITDITDHIAKISTDIENGEGLIHALIYDKKSGDTVKNIAAAADELADTAKIVGVLAKDIGKGEGVLHDLIYQKSPEGLDELLQKFVNTASNLEKASSALAAGGGTLGALLIDSQVYDNLAEITDEAKRSFILRSAIKSSLKNNED